MRLTQRQLRSFINEEIKKRLVEAWPENRGDVDMGVAGGSSYVQALDLEFVGDFAENVFKSPMLGDLLHNAAVKTLNQSDHYVPVRIEDVDRACTRAATNVLEELPRAMKYEKMLEQEIYLALERAVTEYMSTPKRNDT